MKIDHFDNRYILNRIILATRLIKRKKSINSNHFELNTTALEAGVPKSFSINVAAPIDTANSKIRKAINSIEIKKPHNCLKMLFIMIVL
jgi:hypothetical protein